MYTNTISIHAPAKGATLVQIYVTHTLHIFQSTLPRRERLKRRIVCLHPQYFNPRSREGSDIDLAVKLAGYMIFQSTLPRRERHFLTDTVLLCIRFQSTLPRRERLQWRISKFLYSQFQSTLPRRERLSPDRSFISSPYFNPRSREGSDHSWQKQN